MFSLLPYLTQLTQRTVLKSFQKCTRGLRLSFIKVSFHIYCNIIQTLTHITRNRLPSALPHQQHSQQMKCKTEIEIESKFKNRTNVKQTNELLLLSSERCE